MRARARAEKSPLVKDRLYRLLASAADETLARRALELALTDEPGPTNGAQMLESVAEAASRAGLRLRGRARRRGRAHHDRQLALFPRLASQSLDPALAGRLDAFARARFAAGSLPPGARRRPR